MSINVSMRENGVNWNEDIDKLSVPAEIGSNNWVPANSSNLVKMTIGENGTYNASDYSAGGISEADISQSGHHATSTADSSAQKIHGHVTTIPEGGSARYINGVKRVRVNSGNSTVDLYNQQDVGMTTLYVSTAGKYKARDYNAYGFSEIQVAFPTGGDTGDENGWEDAFDGVGLPASIRVTTPPNKISYEKGDTIDYTGMIVKAYKADGTLWENEDYPNGIIPFGELILPSKLENISVEMATKYDYFPKIITLRESGMGYHVTNPEWFGRTRIHDETYNDLDDIGWVGAIFYKNSDNNSYNSGLICAIDIDDYLEEYYENNLRFLTRIYTEEGKEPSYYVFNRCTQPDNRNTYSKNGKTVYFTSLFSFGSGNASGEADPLETTSSSQFSTNDQYIAWNMIFGNKGIIIKWPRAGDKMILETMLQLSVT